MEVDSLGQLIILLRALGLGWALGLLYDLLRALRRSVKSPWLSSVLDAFYGLLLFFLVFFFALRVGNGELRVYLLAGLAAGGLFFFLLCSAPLRPLWDLWVVALRQFFRLCALPVRFFLRQMKYFLQSLKKLFHFRRKYYIMKNCKRGGRRPEQGRGKFHGRS